MPIAKQSDWQATSINSGATAIEFRSGTEHLDDVHLQWTYQRSDHEQFRLHSSGNSDTYSNLSGARS